MENNSESLNLESLEKEINERFNYKDKESEDAYNKKKKAIEEEQKVNGEVTGQGSKDWDASSASNSNYIYSNKLKELEKEKLRNIRSLLNNDEPVKKIVSQLNTLRPLMDEKQEEADRIMKGYPDKPEAGKISELITKYNIPDLLNLKTKFEKRYEQWKVDKELIDTKLKNLLSDRVFLNDIVLTKIPLLRSIYNETLPVKQSTLTSETLVGQPHANGKPSQVEKNGGAKKKTRRKRNSNKSRKNLRKSKRRY